MITCTALILGLHIASYHHDPQSYTNNTNVGAYAECDGWTVGAYRNSINRTSVYGGHTFRHGAFALAVGVVSGYQKQYGQSMCDEGKIDVPWDPCYQGISDSALAPMLAPSVNVGPARLWVVPKTGKSSTTAHLSLEWNFK